MIVFKIVYWAGLVVEIVARAPFQKMYKSIATSAIQCMPASSCGPLPKS